MRDALARVEIGDVDAVARRRPAELSGGQAIILMVPGAVLLLATRGPSARAPGPVA